MCGGCEERKREDIPSHPASLFVVKAVSVPSPSFDPPPVGKAARIRWMMKGDTGRLRRRLVWSTATDKQTSYFTIHSFT